MDHLEKARRVISLEIDELNRLVERVDASFSAAVEMLKSAIETGARITVVGVGKSGNIGSKLAATLNSTGAPTTVLNCQDAIHGDIGLVNKGDVVIALSYSGETDELLALLPHLKRRQIQMIAITGKKNSTLSKAADCVLDVNVEREACPLNLAPTSSTTNMLVLGDALAMVLLEARGFTRDHFAELHPGGSLGKALLLRASDIMRTGDACVRILAATSITDAISKMTKARCGAVTIVNDGGKLLGVFTQGDFVRAFQSGSAAIGSASVGEYMTSDPIKVRENRLVGEVLRLLEDNHIDDLVVVDADGCAVGLIDTQDLARLQVV